MQARESVSDSCQSIVHSTMENMQHARLTWLVDYRVHIQQQGLQCKLQHLLERL